ncbi:hypothetical protein F5Y18DRAFT_296753 [Xylariaceae sp. FL1019]|nr:hypothetical protein F5Y18DRAFT_296753 [Xylariaceae sp. FL1019]
MTDTMPMLTKADYTAMAATLVSGKDMIEHPGIDAVPIQAMPRELLLQIVANSSPRDQVTLALAHPQAFLGTVNIYAIDAEAYLRVTRRKSPPLLLEAIPRLNIDDFKVVLETYLSVSNVFLHSDFAPTFTSSPNGTRHARHLLPPLHVAIESGRLDIFYLLLERGADPRQDGQVPMAATAPTATLRLTPFQYAWQLLTAPHYFYPATAAENRQRALVQQEMAIHLNQYARMQPFDTAPSQPGITLASGLDACIYHGFGALAVAIFKNYDGEYDRMGNLARHMAILRVPERAIQCGWPEGVPFAQYVFEDVGTTFAEVSPDLDQYSQPFRPTDRWLRRLMEVVGGKTIPVERTNVAGLPPAMDNFFVAFGSLLRRDIRGFIQDEVILTRACTDDNMRWAHLGRVLTETSKYPELSYLPSFCLRSAMNRGPRNTALREWLIGATTAIQDGTALLFAIRHRDNSTFCHIVDVLLASGHSIDAKVSSDTNVHTHRKPPIEFYETPLTWALHENNYHQAAKLLMLGADPGQVAVNITDRVRTLRWIVNQDPLNFPYEHFVWKDYDGNDDISNNTRRNVAGSAEKSPFHRRDRTIYEMNYVFRRLLDDPNLPTLPHLEVDMDNLSVHDEDWEFAPVPPQSSSEPTPPRLVPWFQYRLPALIRRSDVLAPVPPAPIPGAAPPDTGEMQNIGSILATAGEPLNPAQRDMLASILRGDSDARNRARAQLTPDRRGTGPRPLGKSYELALRPGPRSTTARGFYEDVRSPSPRSVGSVQPPDESFNASIASYDESFDASIAGHDRWENSPQMGPPSVRRDTAGTARGFRRVESGFGAWCDSRDAWGQSPQVNPSPFRADTAGMPPNPPLEAPAHSAPGGSQNVQERSPQVSRNPQRTDTPSALSVPGWLDQESIFDIAPVHGTGEQLTQPAQTRSNIPAKRSPNESWSHASNQKKAKSESPPDGEEGVVGVNRPPYFNEKTGTFTTYR